MQHFYVFVARGFSDFLIPHLVRTRDLSLPNLLKPQFLPC